MHGLGVINDNWAQHVLIKSITYNQTDDIDLNNIVRKSLNAYYLNSGVDVASDHQQVNVCVKPIR